MSSCKYSRRTTYSKYHARKTMVDGITFDSMKEASRYNQLKLLERAGEITELKLQVPFVLIEKSEHGQAIKYIADFTYYDKNGNYVVEDVKGVKTPIYKLKKRLLAENWGIKIKET